MVRIHLDRGAQGLRDFDQDGLSSPSAMQVPFSRVRVRRRAERARERELSLKRASRRPTGVSTRSRRAHGGVGHHAHVDGGWNLCSHCDRVRSMQQDHQGARATPPFRRAPAAPGLVPRSRPDDGSSSPRDRRSSRPFARQRERRILAADRSSSAQHARRQATRSLRPRRFTVDRRRRLRAVLAGQTRGRQEIGCLHDGPWIVFPSVRFLLPTRSGSFRSAPRAVCRDHDGGLAVVVPARSGGELAFVGDQLGGADGDFTGSALSRNWSSNGTGDLAMRTLSRARGKGVSASKPSKGVTKPS